MLSSTPVIFTELALLARTRLPRGTGAGRAGAVLRQAEWRDLIRLIDLAAIPKGDAYPSPDAVADALPAAAFAVSAGDLAWDGARFTYSGPMADLRELACRAVATAIDAAFTPSERFANAFEAVRARGGYPLAMRWRFYTSRRTVDFTC